MTTTADTQGTGRRDFDPRRPQRGEMTLAQHLRELRNRLLKSGLAIAAGMVIGWIYYDQIFAALREPVDQVITQANAEGKDVKLIISGVAQAFTLKIKIAAMAGLILASPVWLFQLWRFITPGMHRHERRWAYGFVAVAVPLFFGGVLLAYWVLPKGLLLLFGFTPENVANYVSVDAYLSFFVRMVVIFGVGFLTPLIIVALNLVGVLSGRKLAKWWRGIIMGVFVFAAIATPTGDPITLLELAAPILILVGFALVFCFINDRRRARRRTEPDYAAWSDDQTSPL